MSRNRPDERRRAGRVDSLNLVNFEELDKAGAITSALVGRTLDISELGARVELEASSPDGLPDGSHVLLTLALRDELVRFLGRVAYREDAGGRLRRLGVEFLSPAPEKIEALASFLCAVEA